MLTLVVSENTGWPCQPLVACMKGLQKGQHDSCHGTRPSRAGLGKFVLETRIFVRYSTFFVQILSIDLLLSKNTKWKQKRIKSNRNDENTHEINVKKTKNTIDLHLSNSPNVIDRRILLSKNDFVVQFQKNPYLNLDLNVTYKQMNDEFTHYD